MTARAAHTSMIRMASNVLAAALFGPLLGCTTEDALLAPQADEAALLAAEEDLADEQAQEFGQTEGGLTALPNVIGQLPCLDYDGIDSNSTDPYVVSKSMYANHMKWLNTNGYTPMTFKSFLQKLEDPAFPDNGFPAKPVLLFSDSTAQTFYTNAVPELNKYGFKATIGIEGALLGQPWAMSGATMLALESQGFEFANHSWSHPDLSVSGAASWPHEVDDARAAMQALGLTIDTFIYPYGATDAALISHLQSAGYNASRATGAADISGGGYATLNLDRRHEIGCALPLKTTTLAQWKSYMTNTKLELEDLFVVAADVGSNAAIQREIFPKSSYGAVYTGDKGDAVTVKVFVVKPGKYNLKFHVKTGTPEAPLSSATAYQYKVNGVIKKYTQAGPTTADGPYIAWGDHKVNGVQLPKGWVTLTITSMEDWAMLLDWAQFTWVSN